MTAQARKIKTPATNLPVPQSLPEAADALFQIGAHDRRLESLDTELKGELAALKKRFEEQAQPVAQARMAALDGLKIFCEANRQLLTNGGRSKTAHLSSGEVSWRDRPPKVILKDAEKVLEALIERGLRQYTREKIEISKEAILADPQGVAGVKGITVGSGGEDFIATPFAPDGLMGFGS